MFLFRGQFNKQGFNRGALHESKRVLVLKELFSFSDTPTRSRNLVRIIADNLLWMENFRAPMNWVKHINETLRLTEIFSLRRDLVRSITEKRQLNDKPVVHRRLLRLVNENLKLEDMFDYTRIMIKNVKDSIQLEESINHVRNRFQVIKNLFNWEEKISTFSRALLTILGKAETKQTIHCRLGGGWFKMQLSIFKGNDKTFEVHIRDETGRNFNLDGAEIIFMVKKTIKDEDKDAVITKSSADADEIVITNPVGGLCEVYLVPDDTKNLPVKTYVYEVRAITGNGEVYTVVLDEFVIKHVVKRA